MNIYCLWPLYLPLRRFNRTIFIFGLLISSQVIAGPREDVLARLPLWETAASYCASGNGTNYPSKESCDDGDMTLFNGLLCAAGEQLGCEAVKESQDKTGRWFRSPRLAANNHAAKGASFSPDMALGVQLYLVATQDIMSANSWLRWIDNNVPCLLRNWFNKESCWIRSIPQFCPDSANCVMRPGDAEVLSTTVDYLHRIGMPPLPNGSLRGYLGTFGSTILNDYNDHTNKLGYSLHLVAVELYLLRKTGISGKPLDEATETINKRDPGNPFFQYLREGPTDAVANIVLDLCPKDVNSIPTHRFQWSWERQMSEEAWKKSMIWECIFMARLLQ